MAGLRNRYGVNDATDCYRTFCGERHLAWMSFPSAERIAAYRANGVRCKRIGEELFVHEDDLKLASHVDDVAANA